MTGITKKDVNEAIESMEKAWPTLLTVLKSAAEIINSDKPKQLFHAEYNISRVVKAVSNRDASINRSVFEDCSSEDVLEFILYDSKGCEIGRTHATVADWTTRKKWQRTGRRLDKDNCVLEFKTESGPVCYIGKTSWSKCNGILLSMDSIPCDNPYQVNLVCYLHKAGASQNPAEWPVDDCFKPGDYITADMTCDGNLPNEAEPVLSEAFEARADVKGGISHLRFKLVTEGSKKGNIMSVLSDEAHVHVESDLMTLVANAQRDKVLLEVVSLHPRTCHLVSFYPQGTGHATNSMERIRNACLRYIEKQGAKEKEAETAYQSETNDDAWARKLPLGLRSWDVQEWFPVSTYPCKSFVVCCETGNLYMAIKDVSDKETLHPEDDAEHWINVADLLMSCIVEAYTKKKRLDWRPNAAYAKGDEVVFCGGLFRAIQDIAAGESDLSPADDTERWTRVVVNTGGSEMCEREFKVPPTSIPQHQEGDSFSVGMSIYRIVNGKPLLIYHC